MIAMQQQQILHRPFAGPAGQPMPLPPAALVCPPRPAFGARATTEAMHG